MEMKQRAWIGLATDVEHYLHLVNADVEPSRSYRLLVPSRLGLGFAGRSDQVLVTSDVQFYIQGEPHSLLLLLRRAGARALKPQPAVQPV
jgi:hypothetical protein